MSKFMVAARQATELDKKRIRLKTKVRDMAKEASRKVGEKMKLVDMVKELKNLVKELRANIERKLV